jgi:hypothetical protein
MSQAQNKMTDVATNQYMRVIFECSFYESKRHTRPHTVAYFLKQEHTLWAFLSPDYPKVTMIYVNMHSNKYKSAFSNSEIADTTHMHSEVEKNVNESLKHLLIPIPSCVGCGLIQLFACRDMTLSSENTWLCDECFT